MSTRDDAKRLRVRDDAIADGLAASANFADPGAPCLVAQTTKILAYPTGAQSFFACSPVAVLGTEVEGGPATLTTLPPTFLAFNLGSTVPPIGTDVVASYVGNRWVFRYDS